MLLAECDKEGMLGKLDGRRIIITGSASGIGAATAQLFYDEGASLVLLDRNADGLRALADAIGAKTSTVDLTDLEHLERHIDDAASELGGLDGIVNCAGLGVAGPIGKTDLPMLTQVMSVNLIAPYLICRAALPYLLEASRGTIVNIASGQALLPNTPNNTAYSASKGGLVSFSKALAAEAAPRVRVNVVCPGVTNTPMAAPLLAGYDDPATAPWVQQYALRRVAEPDEIARAILFLTSGDSSYVTGTALAVDGGRTFH